jgi:hypothetical protein
MIGRADRSLPSIAVARRLYFCREIKIPGREAARRRSGTPDATACSNF